MYEMTNFWLYNFMVHKKNYRKKHFIFKMLNKAYCKNSV